MKKKTKKKDLGRYELRSRDVAHIADCSPDDVIEFARKGRLKAQKFGRFWRFSLPDVKAWMKEESKRKEKEKRLYEGTR